MASKLFRIKRNWDREEIMVSVYDPPKGDSEIEAARIEVPGAQIMRPGYTREIIYIETPIDDFEEQLVEKALDLIQDNPEAWKKLRWAFAQETINAEMRQLLRDDMSRIVREALRQCAREMKQVITRIW